MSVDGTAAPKISENYFRSLLSQADALDAVYCLSGFWLHRLQDSRPMFGLSRPEYYCQLLQIYSGEVNNGGHFQFFMNRGCNLLDDYVAALEEISLPYVAQILVQAAAVRDNREQLSRFDKMVDAEISDLDRAIQGYMRQNSDDILVPERS